MNKEYSYHGKINQDVNWKFLVSGLSSLPFLFTIVGVLGSIVRFDIKDFVLFILMAILSFRLVQKSLLFYSDIVVSENGLVFRHVNFLFEKRNYSWEKLLDLEVFEDKSIVNIDWTKIDKNIGFYLLPSKMKGLPISNIISRYDELIRQLSVNLEDSDKK